MYKRPILAVVIILASVMIFSSISSAQVGSSKVPNGEYFLPANIAGKFPTGLHNTHLMNPGTKLSVMVSLNYRNEAALTALLSNLQDPKSPDYHHYLSADQFDQMFSPSSSVYYALAQYFESSGFVVKTYSDRLSLVLAGTAENFETVFGTSILTGSYDGRDVFAPAGQLHMNSILSKYISNIVGMNDLYKPHISPLFQGSGSSQTLYGADMQAAYQLNKLYQAKGYPTNETIATILWSGYDSNGNSVAPFVPSDISYYFNNNLPSGQPRSTVYGYPIGGAPVPGPSAANDQSQANFESTLDLEMAGSTAPGATLVEVYGPSATQEYLDQAFAAVLNPSYNTSVNSALSHVVAISNSWGETDSNDSTWMQYEQQAAARGITVLASSGDSGNSNSAAPSFPATMSYDNFGTLAVGGAAMQLTGTASTDGSGTTGISTQSVWYNTPNTGDGSQGGVSSVYSEPTWQLNSADANSVITGASSITGLSSGRGTPDVSADGANMEIYITYGGSSSYQELWGTSVASPLTAGLIATMDHSLTSNEGFMNSLVYRLGQVEVSQSYSIAPPFYFIYNGSNGAFSAQNGYSLAVGWGSINAYNFVAAQSYYSVTLSTSNLYGNTWSVRLGSSSLGYETHSTSGTSITFHVLGVNTYNYQVMAPVGWSATPSSGSIAVAESPVTVGITFNPTEYSTVRFIESGLPSGTYWSVNIGGQEYSEDSAISTSMAISVIYGNLRYSIPNSYNQPTHTEYYPSPSDGTVKNVGGAANNQQFPISFSTNNGCVNGTTEILLANGTYEQAHNIVAGTYVLTYNVTTNTYQSEIVRNVYLSNHSEMYTINGYLQTSAYQPLLTNHGYIEAQNLTQKDKLYNALTGKYVNIWSITQQKGNYTMYDFDIPPTYDFIAWNYVVYDLTRAP